MGNIAEWERFDIPTSSETKRGVCLDSTITMFTFGLLGIETTIITPELIVIPLGSMQVDQIPSIDTYTLSMRARKAVVIQDFHDFNEAQVKRRLVRSRRE